MFAGASGVQVDSVHFVGGSSCSGSHDFCKGPARFQWNYCNALHFARGGTLGFQGDVLHFPSGGLRIELSSLAFRMRDLKGDNGLSFGASMKCLPLCERDHQLAKGHTCTNKPHKQGQCFTRALHMFYTRFTHGGISWFCRRGVPQCVKYVLHTGSARCTFSFTHAQVLHTFYTRANFAAE